MIVCLQLSITVCKSKDVVFTQSCLEDLGGLLCLSLDEEHDSQEVVGLQRVAVLVTEFVEARYQDLVRLDWDLGVVELYPALAEGGEAVVLFNSLHHCICLFSEVQPVDLQESNDFDCQTKGKTKVKVRENYGKEKFKLTIRHSGCC